MSVAGMGKLDGAGNLRPGSGGPVNEKEAQRDVPTTSAPAARRIVRNGVICGLAITPLLVMGIGPANAAEPVTRPATATDPTPTEPALPSNLQMTSPRIASNSGALLAGNIQGKQAVIPNMKWSKADVAVRNKETYAKARPMWLQAPVLVRKGKRYAFNASVSARTHRVTRKGADLHAASKKDRLDFDLKVARDGKSASSIAKQDFSLRKLVRVSPARHGVVSFTVPVSKTLGKQLMKLSAPQLRNRTAITLYHHKDTFSDVPGYEYQMIVPGQATKKRLSKKAIRSTKARNARKAKRLEGGLRTRNDLMDQPTFQQLEFQNSTPFTQEVNFNPNAACMNQPALINANTIVTTQPISPYFGLAVVDLGLANVTADLGNGSSTSGTWFGETANQEQSGSAQPWNTAGQIGQAALDSFSKAPFADPALYSLEGVAVGATTAAVGFFARVLKNATENPNSCNNFGQFWHATSTAVGIPLDGNQNPILYGTPQDWAKATYVNQGANGPQTVSDIVTSAANAPATMPTGQQLTNLTGTVMSAVGTTTQATYFHNAGMPAPMAGVPGHSNWAGTMSWSQGMTQTVFPNPGACPAGGCQQASTAVQLLYLTNGAEDPFGPTLDELPTLTATTSPDEQDPSNKQLNLQCNIGDGGSWISPYGGTSANPTNTAATQLASINVGQQNVDTAQYAVAYYAKDAAGNYLYSPSSVANYPGIVTSTNGTTGLPALGPNAGQQIISMNSNQPSAASLSSTDIQNLVDVNGKPQTPVSWGCAVTPFLGWTSMPINGSSPAPENGNNWPFPATAQGAAGPLGVNPFSDPNPVNAINLSWAGSTYTSLPMPLSSVNVSSLTPATGPVTGATNVTIKGTGFQSGATVTIGGVPCASPVVVSAKTITCVTAAVTDASNKGTIAVTNPNEGTYTSPALFKYTSVVSSVSPTIGGLAGGTPITITGIGFGRDSTVNVGGTACANPVVTSTTTITCTTSAVSQSGAVDVEVTTPDPLSTATLADGFTFAEDFGVTGHDPFAISVDGGDLVTIFGWGFAAGATVELGGVACTGVTVVSETRITCTSGAHAYDDNAAVTVAIPSKVAAPDSITIGYHDYEVMSVSPSSGPVAGGETVTISGFGFAAGATVEIGGVPCTGVNVVSSTQITCTTGPSSAGLRYATVAMSGKRGGTLGGYTYE